MPYSERFGFVHVAIPKTGTTSVVRALKRLHELHGGELTLVEERIDRSFRRRYGLDATDGLLSGRAKHLSADHLRSVLGERFDRGLVFSFVRNPWARAVSRYFFTHADNRPSAAERARRGTRRKFHRLSFAEWLERKAGRADRRGETRHQLDKLTDGDGRLLVDVVGKLENVQQDFARICERLGVPAIPVPHVNGTGRGRHYTEHYDARTRALADELFRVDAEAFGYEFGA